jgi:hypothetical protein
LLAVFSFAEGIGMAKRLGEVLIDEGKITDAQLQKALKAQLIFGGHLGTSLIELGYIDERALGTALARAFNVNYATYEILMGAPYAVIRAIPAKLVEKFKVIPIRLDGKVLQLAMLDPKNLMALDEISFVTGYKIVPWVAPEIRIFQVLEKYYNIARSQRYISLAKELGKLESPDRKIHPARENTKGAAAQPAAGNGDGGETAPVKVQSGETPPAGAQPPGQGRDKLLPDHWEKYGYGKSWRDYADEMERETSPLVAATPANPASPTPEAPAAPTGPEPPAPAPAPAPAPESVKTDQPKPAPDTPAGDPLMDAARLLQRCTTPEELADVVLSFASRYLSRTALFIIRGDQAVGWSGAGPGFDSARIKGMNLPLGRDSLVSLVDDGRKHFIGRVPAFPSIKKMFQELGAPMPNVVLAIPIRINERTASLLYGDGGPDDDLRTLNVDTFERLGNMASLALQMIIFRNKITSA